MVAQLPGQSEQNPLDWLEAAAVAVAEAGRQTRQTLVKAGFGHWSAVTSTLVVLTDEESLAPAIVWERFASRGLGEPKVGRTAS